MGLRTVVFILLGVIHILICSSPISAQIPERLERCLPYPTLAEEIKDMQDEVEAKERKTPQQKVVIDAVNFDGPIHLPNSIREQLITELKQHEFDGDSDWLGVLQEVPVTEAWQDQGYFRVNSTAEAQIISGDSRIQHVSVTVHVNEGLQYRLGDVGFREAHPNDPLPFTAEELRKLVPLREGDLFNVAKIRESFEALKKFYGSNGYIDFTASPDTEVDDASQRISLVMILQEGEQFRVGKIEVFGLKPSKAAMLTSTLKPGEVFNRSLVDEFIKENMSALPVGASPHVLGVKTDAKKRTLDIVVDFRPWPQQREF